MKNKRGISPLIATVLIIGFTIVLAALVITWGTNLFQKTVAETETASNFNLACTTGLKLKVENKILEVATPPTYLDIILRNDNQDRAIEDFRVVLTLNDGTSVEGEINVHPSDADTNMELGFPVPRKYQITPPLTGDLGDLSELDRVSLYPSFTIEGDTRSCENSISINV